MVTVYRHSWQEGVSGGVLGAALRSSQSPTTERGSGARLGGLSSLCSQGPRDGA